MAIITGAGSGIGRATAHRFADEGARLVLNDIDEAYLAELEAALGADHAYVLGDVSVEETAERLAATARERFGRIDALVNNVGDLFIGEITETSVEAWDRLMATNLRSMFLCCKHAIPAMLEQGGGSIVNLASISAFIGQEAEEGGPSVFATASPRPEPASSRPPSRPATQSRGSASTRSRRGRPARVRCGTSCRTVARRDRAYDLVFVRQLKPEDHEHRVGDGLTPA